MRTGRPKAVLLLSREERQRLQSLAHRSRSAPFLASRAHRVAVRGRARQQNRRTNAARDARDGG
jgi:hypothetical protein